MTGPNQVSLLLLFPVVFVLLVVRPPSVSASKNSDDIMTPKRFVVLTASVVCFVSGSWLISSLLPSSEKRENKMNPATRQSLGAMLRPTEVEAAIIIMDQDNDGKVTLAEFQAWWAKSSAPEIV